MTYKARNFYSYFKDCYKLDNKEFVVDNVLAQKYSYKWFVSGKEELINDDLPIIPFLHKKVNDLQKDIELYKLEKKLFYACFFLLGKSNNALIKDKRVCAPLILYPANIQCLNEETFLEIEKESFIINRSVISKLETKDDSLQKDEFINELSDLLASGRGSLMVIKNLLDKYFINIETSDVLLFPNVWSAAKIRKDLAENGYEDNTFKIVPAAGTVFIEKSESSLKVINDLREMADSESFNSNLEELLGEHENSRSFNLSFYKSRLNTDQYQALQNAYQYTNSVIVGPPGTGKTYTITSIISDAIVNNQSVLVVSKTKQAVEVLRSMLQDDFKLKNYLIHTSGSRYKWSLKAKIQSYLSGMSARNGLFFDENDINRLYEKLEGLEEKFKKYIDRELEISDLTFSEDLNWLEKWRKFYLKDISTNGTKLWELFDQIEKTIKSLDRQISLFSRRKIESNIKRNSNKYRRDIALFYDALDASGFTEYKNTISKIYYKNILKVFPIWLANLSDLNSVLPLQKDLFDLVIIDEATQCDIASALPALYRSKRVVVTGDPNQLKHYSFVSRSQQNNLRLKYDLSNDKIFDYRGRSILDFFIAKVQSQDQITFLREHFRSTPSLIEFSNQHFYNGQLEVLKSTPKHVTNRQIELIELEGQRDQKGINETEADAVIAYLDKLITEYTTQKEVPTIGIISPFSSQVNYINKLLKDKYELNTLKRFNILCGTPYNFQGSEREIILMSFAVCNNTHPSAFIHASKPEVLNVAITRAKSYQVIFKSVSDDKLKKESLLYQYFKFIREYTHYNEDEVTLDQFQQEVVSVLSKKDYDDIKCGYPIAGSLLDILVSKGGNNYFIDLIGYPGIYREAFTFERYKTLARTGIKCLPLHYSYWNKNRKEAVRKLVTVIK
ncbi:DEAD/DEAH box helicase [Carboxylicivirga linearis]|uniref:DNA2/NAM7 family helicase n=1 Tax=Carboxylicivirga linearis TaxID=1628157 RepID=A0ABS5K164_9BACT|nr:DEAD/DEAH box helicase [Carboxylicivirga linearis]MBS2100920.1 DNA2/NAM7 family helicase [Carboxylicivirga linearis]